MSIRKSPISLPMSNQLRNRRALSMSFCQDTRRTTRALLSQTPPSSGSSLMPRKSSRRMHIARYSQSQIQRQLTHQTRTTSQYNRRYTRMRPYRRNSWRKLKTMQPLSATKFRFQDRHSQQIKTRSKEVISKTKPPT